MNHRRPLKIRLKELRKKNGYSIEELAEILNATQGQIVSWENSEMDPPVRKVIQMARHFQCSTDYILGLDSNPEYYDKDNDEYEYEEDEEDEDFFLIRWLKKIPIWVWITVVFLLFFLLIA